MLSGLFPSERLIEECELAELATRSAVAAAEGSRRLAQAMARSVEEIERSRRVAEEAGRGARDLLAALERHERHVRGVIEGPARLAEEAYGRGFVEIGALRAPARRGGGR